ncbi:rod shape-determining protein MreC [Granulicella rosea]|uniref:Cell shape-determining protein MreC n=1 Tax=Granulicella rosea TaxID=474952 RepID=A0A239L4X8_9BACT|nr:rod shape-determining protein MreC [Granulicella rosea]SNT25052.1 rod shape-determining protein MreC [Granulicella rosea]
MESFFSRFKNQLVLIVILLVQTIALAVQVRRPVEPGHPDAESVRLLRYWASSLMTPAERISTGFGHSVRGGWSSYVGLRNVRAENEALKKQIAEMRLQQAAISEDALEGQRLQKLLDFREHYVASTIAAQVIGTSGSEQSRMLTLNKGYEDGLKTDMAVITPDGIVGKLRLVFPHSSELLLVNDPTSGAGVILESTRIRAILHGSANGRVQITNLTQDSRIKPGEKVITSGGDQVFPRGLAVGVIESIVPDPEHQPYTLITLKPAANLFQLEEVLVITGTQPNLPGDAQQQLAADAEKHAADVSAERLPSIHDGPATEADPSKPTDETAPPANNSTDLVPKPKPALHPDRYSPGTAAPAAELTPGSPRPATDAPAVEPVRKTPVAPETPKEP